MPEKDKSPQYRIRSDEERHERVASEDMLQAIAPALDIVEAAEQLFAPQEKRAPDRDKSPPATCASATSKVRIHMQVLVRDNNVDQALRVLKKKMQREGIIRELKARRAYEKPSEKRVREKAEAIRRARKAARKQAQREGLLPPPKPRVPVGGRKPAPARF